MSDSLLDSLRANYHPPLIPLFDQLDRIELVEEPEVENHSTKELSELFLHSWKRPNLHFKQNSTPSSNTRALRVGVLFSGGQAPGGHNVVTGLFDALQKINPKSILLGFLGGPKGLIENTFMQIDKSSRDRFHNRGGFNMLGSGRTKIESSAQFEAVRANVAKNQLDGLVIIGGDDSNTNAAFLAEDFAKAKLQVAVVGVPKTIDGDLQNRFVEISFGFDTATKIYSEMIGNLGTDTLSSKKYTHFVRLMGRSASHVTLECALRVQPNLALISEEMQKKSLAEVVDEILKLLIERAEANKYYGLILIPEGLLEFIPQFKRLIDQINQKIAQGVDNVIASLEIDEKHLFDSLPEKIQQQLFLQRDPHGNIQLSHIESEKLLIDLVYAEYKKRGLSFPFHPLAHFFGYEGRSGYPTNFDANYCTNLGYVAALLVREGRGGYMAAIQNLASDLRFWQPAAASLVKLLQWEERGGRKKAVIAKALVSIEDRPFLTFVQRRERWRVQDCYLQSGPIQFFGPGELVDQVPNLLRIKGKVESQSYA